MLIISTSSSSSSSIRMKNYGRKVVCVNFPEFIALDARVLLKSLLCFLDEVVMDVVCEAKFKCRSGWWCVFDEFLAFAYSQVVDGDVNMNATRTSTKCRCKPKIEDIFNPPGLRPSTVTADESGERWCDGVALWTQWPSPIININYESLYLSLRWCQLVCWIQHEPNIRNT